jgi:RimJ/RimL family protein N-acetyltransferase
MTMIDFKSNITLEFEGVVLRPWSPDDADLMTTSATNPLIWEYTTSALATEADVRKYVAQAIADRDGGKRYSFAVCLKSGEIVGSSSFGNVSEKDRRVEIGWSWLAPEYHGKGLNSVMKYVMVKYCFEALKVHRVEFKTDDANPRSCGALRKIGARREGVLRSHTLMHDGRYRDTAYYSILEDEWPQVSKALSSLAAGARRER